MTREADHASRFTHHVSLSPTRLRHAGYVSFKREPAEAQTAERELAQITAAAAAPSAPVMNSRGEYVEVQSRRSCALDRLLVGFALLLFNTPLGVLESPLELVRFIG